LNNLGQFGRREVNHLGCRVFSRRIWLLCVFGLWLRLRILAWLRILSWPPF
jgi:hypothetical protein